MAMRLTTFQEGVAFNAEFAAPFLTVRYPSLSTENYTKQNHTSNTKPVGSN